MKYETDPTLLYLQSVKHVHEVERPERNPLWNFIYAAASGAHDFNVADAVWALQRILMDLISRSTPNSFRWDVHPRQDRDRFQRPRSLLPLPPDERAIMKRNGNPYQLDGRQRDPGRRRCFLPAALLDGKALIPSLKNNRIALFAMGFFIKRGL